VTRSTRATRPAPATRPAAPSRAPAAHRPTTPATSGRWTIQIGSFTDRANALRLARRWKAHGYAAYVSTAGRGPRALHRVRMGAFTSRDAAIAFARKIRAQGQRASVVPPGH
jgi:DedD protein